MPSRSTAGGLWCSIEAASSNVIRATSAFACSSASLRFLIPNASPEDLFRIHYKITEDACPSKSFRVSKTKGWCAERFPLHRRTVLKDDLPDSKTEGQKPDAEGRFLNFESAVDSENLRFPVSRAGGQETSFCRFQIYQ